MDEKANSITTIEALKSENQELRCMLDKFDDKYKKLEINYNQDCAIITEQNKQIKFLEGQIEAYQYCMNCRR